MQLILMRDSTRKVLCGAIAVALSPLAHAQSAAVIPAEDGIRWLGRVVVVASKAAEPAAQVVGTVSSLDRETIERRQVQTIADLVRYEPGVDALGDVSRFGWQGFSVRGLDGNRRRGGRLSVIRGGRRWGLSLLAALQTEKTGDIPDPFQMRVRHIALVFRWSRWMLAMRRTG